MENGQIVTDKNGNQKSDGSLRDLKGYNWE